MKNNPYERVLRNQVIGPYVTGADPNEIPDHKKIWAILVASGLFAGYGRTLMVRLVEKVRGLWSVRTPSDRPSPLRSRSSNRKRTSEDPDRTRRPPRKRVRFGRRIHARR